MKTYFSVFRLRLINNLQYRAAALAGVATQFFWGMMHIMIYEAFYANAVSTPPMSLKQVVTYVWLQQAFLVFIALWVRDEEIFNLITSGNIAYELCRPCNIYGFWYAKLIAQRLSGAMLRCFPILILAFFFPEPYRMTLPPSAMSFFLFIISLLLGLMVVVSISMLIYISVFITMSPVGSMLIISTAGEFFSGMIIPIPLMPLWLQKVAYFLPFRLAADMPFRVYTGHIPPAQALTGMLIQLIWLGILVLTGNAFMKRIMKRIVVQGG